MKTNDYWRHIDQEFIFLTLKKYFGLNKRVARMLLDYVKAHPEKNEHNDEVSITYRVSGPWLQPSGRLHYLYIDSMRGLSSTWIEKDSTFCQAMEEAKEQSLINLKIFLMAVENNQACDELLSNDEKGLQLWDRQYMAKYGELP